MFVYAFVKPIVCMRLNNKIIIIKIIIIIIDSWKRGSVTLTTDGCTDEYSLSQNLLKKYKLQMSD
jgi:hypothetical protein